MTAAETTPRIPPLTGGARTIALWVVLLAFFVDLLDNTIVNVAIPSIQNDLGATYSAIQWIIAGYALSFALFLITGGRLGDIFGYRTLFLIGMTGFTIASVLSGLAANTEMLVGSRLLQGFMAAMMVPQILATIQVMYPSMKERQGVSAFYGALAGLATVLGPIVGALLISGNLWDLGWRTIFLINLPFGIIAIILGFIFLPDAKSPHPLRLDLLGVALVVVAMLMLMYPLIQGRELGWPTWTFVSMAAALIVFVAFGWSQVAKDRRDGSPLVAPHLFRGRSFVAGIFIIGLFFAVVSGFFLTLTLYLQIGMGYSVLKAGLTSIPFSLGVSVAAGVSGPVLVPRFGRNIVTAGPLVLIVAFALLIGTITFFGASVTPWELTPSLVLGGIGMGFVIAPVYPFVLAEVPLKDAGSASGVISAVGQVGAAIGVAIVGVIYFGLLGSLSTGSAGSVRTALEADLTAAGVPSFAQTSIVDSFTTCFHDRASGQDFTAVPESCRTGEKAMAGFAASQPTIAAAVGSAIEKRAKEANQVNFTGTFARTLTWMIGGLVIVTLATFFLPPRPRREEDLAAAGVAA